MLLVQIVETIFKTSEPRHEKTCFMSYANNKSTDQPAHLCSLISTLVQYLNLLNPISRLELASVAKQTSLTLTCSQTPEDRFFRDVAHY